MCIKPKALGAQPNVVKLIISTSFILTQSHRDTKKKIALLSGLVPLCENFFCFDIHQPSLSLNQLL